MEVFSYNPHPLTTRPMSIHGRLIAPIGLLLALPAPIRGQTVDSLYPGLRIRVVSVGESRRVEGSFATIDTGFLKVVPEGAAQPIAIPLTEIRSLQAASGSRRPLAKGALWGAITGLALGAGLTLALDGQCIDCVDSDGGAPVVIGFTTVIGAAFGLAVGASIVKDRWQTLAPPYH